MRLYKKNMLLFQLFFTLLLGVFIPNCLQSAISVSGPIKAFDTTAQSINSYDGDNKNEIKKIVIFGAGYVGTITGACLAKCGGHSVTFIDPNAEKVEALNAKRTPIAEPQLEPLIREGVENGFITAFTDIGDTILEADIAMIAVGTPTTSDGLPQLDSLQSVLITLRHAAEKRKRPLIVSIRSTVPPNALRHLVRECLGDKNLNISVVVNPEFLRESTAVHDFFHAPFCIVGGDDLTAVNTILSLYKEICPKRFAVSFESACLLKYTCNAFHALKIAFTNEIASICESLEVNPIELMKVFCEDQSLNCSSAYLKPGFAFGGSCLPKDLRALLSLGQNLGEPLPVLSAILPSNRHRFQSMIEKILNGNHKCLAVLGISFKKNTDDIRESPFVELIEQLDSKGIGLKIYDPDVQPEILLGSNRQMFIQRMEHLIPMIKNDLQSALEGCDGLILCKDLLSAQFFNQLKDEAIPIYDLNYCLSAEKCSP